MVKGSVFCSWCDLPKTFVFVSSISTFSQKECGFSISIVGNSSQAFLDFSFNSGVLLVLLSLSSLRLKKQKMLQSGTNITLKFYLRVQLVSRNLSSAPCLPLTLLTELTRPFLFVVLFKILKR